MPLVASFIQIRRLNQPPIFMQFLILYKEESVMQIRPPPIHLAPTETSRAATGTAHYKM